MSSERIQSSIAPSSLASKRTEFHCLSLCSPPPGFSSPPSPPPGFSPSSRLSPSPSPPPPPSSRVIAESRWKSIEAEIDNVVHRLEELKRVWKETGEVIIVMEETWVLRIVFSEVDDAINKALATMGKEVLGFVGNRSHRYRVITAPINDYSFDNFKIVLDRFSCVLELMEVIDPHCTPEMRKRLWVWKERVEVQYKEFVFDLESESLIGEICYICLEELEHCVDLATVGVCSHKYHSHCIKRWLWNSDTCPVCRKKTEGAVDCSVTLDWISEH